MSRPKVWTARRAGAARQVRAAAAREVTQARQRTRRRILAAAASMAGVAAFVAAGVHAAGSHSPFVLAVSAASGSLVVGGTWCHRWLRRRLGGTTAVLAMALVGGAVCLALAASAGHCPGSSAAGRCTTGELANWSLVGMLLPLAGAVIFGVPAVLGRTGYRITRYLLRAWARTAQPGTPATLRRLPGGLARLAAKVGATKRPPGATASRNKRGRTSDDR